MKSARDVEEIAREIIEIAHPLDCAIENELREAIKESITKERAERERLPSFDEVETANAKCNGNLRKLYDWLVERMK